MTKRPSLAESLKAVERAPAAPVPREPEAAPADIGTTRKPFHAATRTGLKKVTTGVEPATRKALKRLSIEQDKSVEDLLREAIDDLLAKHK